MSRMPLPAGKELTWDDLTTVALPEALVPPGAVRLGTELVGRRLAWPVAGGAPIVDARLEGGPPPTSPDDVTTASVAIGGLASVVRGGDRLLAVRAGRSPCLRLEVEVLEPGSPTRVQVATSRAGAVAEPGLVWLLPADDAGGLPLSPCVDEPTGVAP